jgi:hypothetical protein
MKLYYSPFSTNCRRVWARELRCGVVAVRCMLESLAKVLAAKVEEGLDRVALLWLLLGRIPVEFLRLVILLLRDQIRYLAVRRWRLLFGLPIDQKALLERADELDESIQVDRDRVVEQRRREPQTSQLSLASATSTRISWPTRIRTSNAATTAA